MKTQSYLVRELAPARLTMYDGVFRPNDDIKDAMAMCALMDKHEVRPRLYTSPDYKGNIQIAGSIAEIGKAIRRTARHGPVNWETRKGHIRLGIYRMFYKEWRDNAEAEAPLDVSDVYGSGDYIGWACDARALHDAIIEMRRACGVGTPSNPTTMHVLATSDGIDLQATTEYTPREGKMQRLVTGVRGATQLTVRPTGVYGAYNLREIVRLLPALKRPGRLHMHNGPHKPLTVLHAALGLQWATAPTNRNLATTT